MVFTKTKGGNAIDAKTAEIEEMRLNIWLFRNYGGKGYFYCWCGLAFDVSVTSFGTHPVRGAPLGRKRNP
ncbi:MAG: hypothetical protein LBB74_03645, partial [Chitinispirillales bacterium]|nr:hypothetical protein [Chitinispirillales bacterium]